MKLNWQDVRIPNHDVETIMMGSHIEKELHAQFMEATKKYGWGGKRRLLEAAIHKILTETDFN